jgi:protease I
LENIMSDELNGRKIAFLVANEGVEEVELRKPWEAVENAGGTPVLIAPERGKVQAFNHLDKANQYEATEATDSASADDYDGLVLPGGVANPDQLRTNDHAVNLVADFVNNGTPIGVICHGPWTLIEADAVRGRKITSWPSLQTDLRNAGAEWVDEEVVNDKGLVSSRNPDDLPAFCAKIVEEFAEGEHPVASKAGAASA